MPETLPAHPAARLVCRYLPAINSLRRYSLVAARADLLAGLSVAAVAVPQAMAYAIAAGVPPMHGLYTAVVMTAVGALFASSKLLINGPTNVISIAVLSALAPIPLEQKLAAAFTLTLLVGLFQTLITLFRLGDLTRYISHSVVVGFTLGASLLLVIDQTRNFFGLGGGRRQPRALPGAHLGGLDAERSAAPADDAYRGGLDAAWCWACGRLKKKLGWPLLPELLLTVIWPPLLWPSCAWTSRGWRWSARFRAGCPSSPGPRCPSSTCVSLSESALAIAVLGLLEALAMAKHLAAHTGQKFDLNQQCMSEGLANLTGSLFQCIPGSGSLTRSAINQQAGARTQWSGVWSAVAVALITVLFAPYAQHIPRAALAGILMVTAMGMVDWKALPFHLRATLFDAVIVLTTAVAAIGVSVEFCILIGVFASFLLAVPRAGRMTRTEFVVRENGVVRERAEGEPADPRLLLFGLEGELFFGSSLALDTHLTYFEQRAAEGAKVVVLRVKRLRNPDAVGMREISQFVREMKEMGVRVILAGVRADLLAGLRKAGALDGLDEDQVFPERQAKGSSTMEAVAAAYAYLAKLAAQQAKTPVAQPELSHFEV